MQRIINLMGAWHSQLLEVMGAMGIREARRLRGEPEGLSSLKKSIMILLETI